MKNVHFNLVRIATLSAALAAELQGFQAHDSFGYTVSANVPFSYLDISSTGSTVLANTDDGTALIQLGFAFRFYGQDYSALCVSANGNMTFGGCPPNDVTNVDLSAVNPPGNLPMIAPYWTDLTFSVPGAGSVAYQTVGGAGSRRFIAQWNKAFAQNSQTAYNFEVILFEGSNNISVQFETIQGGPANVAAGAGASVGIRDANGALNGHVLQFSYNAPALTNNSALLFTSPAACPSIDLSSDVQVTTSAFTYNRSSKIFSGTVNVLNTSSVSLPAPLSVVLTQLSPGVTAINASATLPAGPSYSLASSLVPAGSSAFTVQFTDPSNVRIAFQPKTYGCQPAPASNE